MAKRLCKMNRKQIADSLGEIHRLVSDSKYVCRSCARSSSSKASLCKPAPIPPKSCQTQPIAEQKKCALLAEALPKQHSPEKAEAIRRVVERVKEKVAQPQSFQEATKEAARVTAIDEFSSKREIKDAKKALKKYYNQQKKLLKLAKKQQKLLKKKQKIEAKLPVPIVLSATNDTVASSNIH